MFKKPFFRNFLLLLLGSVILVSAIMLCVFFQEKKKFSGGTFLLKGQFESVFPKKLMEWGVYQNQKYGFQILFPPKWKILKEVPFGEDAWWEVGFSPNDWNNPSLAPVSLFVRAISLQEAIKVNTNNGMVEGDRVIVGGGKGVRVVLKKPESETLIVLVPKNEHLVFELRNNLERFKDEFNKMVATFQILEKNFK